MLISLHAPFRLQTIRRAEDHRARSDVDLALGSVVWAYAGRRMPMESSNPHPGLRTTGAGNRCLLRRGGVAAAVGRLGGAARTMREKSRVLSPRPARSAAELIHLHG